MKRTIGSIFLSTAAALSLSACMTNDGMSDDTASASSDSVMTPEVEDGKMDMAAKNPMVGGAEMYPTKTIVENASAASNLTTLVAAVKAADLVATLSGPGPFTVFAPTNAAFDRLAPGTVETLLKPENKATLQDILTYHVIAGDVSAAQAMSLVEAGGGTATVQAVNGDQLTLGVVNGDLSITDANGTTAYVQMADIKQSNGVVHVINGVLVPK